MRSTSLWRPFSTPSGSSTTSGSDTSELGATSQRRARTRRSRLAALEARGRRIAVVGITDHPADYAAGPDQPGVAFADLRHGVPHWLTESIGSVDADVVLVTPHWGPNMAPEPHAYVRAAAHMLVDAGTTLVAGHSAHVFHGVERRILYDLGGFLDDYAVDPDLRNDLGLLFVVTVRDFEPVRLEAFPLKLDFCFTRLAEGEDAAWITRRFRDACRPLGTDVRSERGRLVVSWPAPFSESGVMGASPGTSDRDEG